MNRGSVTSHDVARLAGVSRTTVSYVLNRVETANISEDTQQRVYAAARKLGYVPNAAAQMLAGQRSHIVGLVFPRTYPHLSTHMFLLEVMEGLVGIAQQNGVRLLIDSVESSLEDAYIELVRSKRIDGLILIDILPDDDRALKSLVADGFPVVSIGYVHDDICCVDVDTRSGARTAVEHLISLGHTHIGCVNNYPVTRESPGPRLQGYQDALADAGIPFDERLITSGQYSPESGLAAMDRLLDGGISLTAVFVASDIVAFGAMRAIQARGLAIPDDIAVIGFDDVPLARFANPPLSTVRVPADRQGQMAGQLLVQQIQEEAITTYTRLDTQLVARESTLGSV
ncbi:MAG: LacI family DNA-binding transcriptional regulator [Caldilineaceae bacterium]|nr:LacI family DNA-binding transcriptional regulator [Caldilineaceae bacterium]